MDSGRGRHLLAAAFVLGAGGVVAVGVSGMLEAGPGDADPASWEASSAVSAGPAAGTRAMPVDGGAAPVVTVWKSPNCGCCGGWVEHLRANGFTVEVEDIEDPQELSALKAEMGVTSDLASCHTARVGDLVVEGHVPADAIRRFLALEDPEGDGLAVPGMPIGSPGMEVPGRGAEPYQVLAFDDDGSVRVFEER